MRFPDITIAVDGFSSTGKSTFARQIAQHFDFLYLDSGAMYRGVTLFAQEQGLISPDNVIDPALEKALEGLDLHFAPGTILHMGERNIEKEIRTMEVSSQVSPIAVEDIQYIIAKLKYRNIGVIITDHNVGETLAITDRAYLLYEGTILQQGTPAALAADEDVRTKYLGAGFQLKRSVSVERARAEYERAQAAANE